MIYFLYHLKTRPTGRVIAKALRFRRWGTTRIAPKTRQELVLRWGNSDPIVADVEINRAEGIQNAANKWRTLSVLQGEGVPVPNFSRRFGDMGDYSIVYGRDSYGARGRGIVIYDRERGDVPRRQHSFYTQGIDIAREYRLHVVRNEVVRVQGKYLDYPEQDRSGGKVCNHANGYRFRTPRRRLLPERESDAIKAVAALGLDFGAVDMVLDTDGKHYVLEVNTGPSCSPMTANAYCQALAKLIAEVTEGRYRPEVYGQGFSALTEVDEAPVMGGV